MKRTMEVIVDGSSWPGGAAPHNIAAVKGARSASTLEALIFTALCTRPPTVTGFHLSDVWAWFRYAFAFDSGPALRLRSEWAQVDAHQKTVLSDELGVGFTTHLLAERFGCRQFADTLYTVSVLNPGMFSIGKTASRGPRKTPDYIAIDGTKKYWIIECKGTQTSRKALDGQLKTGCAQKKNVLAAPHVALAHSLVAGLFIPQYANAETACIKLADPSWAAIDRVLRDTPREQVQEAIVQVSLAKELALCGLAEPADILANAPLQKARVMTASARQAMRQRIERPEEEAVFDSEDLWRRVEARPVSIGRARFYASPPPALLNRLSAPRQLNEDIRELAIANADVAWAMTSSEHEAAVRSPLGFRFRIVLD